MFNVSKYRSHQQRHPKSNKFGLDTKPSSLRRGHKPTQRLAEILESESVDKTENRK